MLLLANPEHTDQHRLLHAKELAALACLVVRRVDEAAWMHFEMSGSKDLEYAHVEEYHLTFVDAPHFSATHKEDTTALDLIMEGMQALCPGKLRDCAEDGRKSPVTG